MSNDPEQAEAMVWQIITHERAMIAAQRFIDEHFNNTPHHGRVETCVPAKETDDDILLTRYIRQQQAASEYAKREPSERKIDGKFSIRGGQIVNTVSGEAIPEDEPLFLLRGRDHHALEAIQQYRHICVADCNSLHMDGINQTANKFAAFQMEHPERMKQPGITRHLKLEREPSPSKCSVQSVHAPHTFGGRPMQFCSGIEPEWKKCPQCGRENSVATWQNNESKCPNCNDLHERERESQPAGQVGNCIVHHDGPHTKEHRCIDWKPESVPAPQPADQCVRCDRGEVRRLYQNGVYGGPRWWHFDSTAVTGICTNPPLESTPAPQPAKCPVCKCPQSCPGCVGTRGLEPLYCTHTFHDGAAPQVHPGRFSGFKDEAVQETATAGRTYLEPPTNIGEALRPSSQVERHNAEFKAYAEAYAAILHSLAQPDDPGGAHEHSFTCKICGLIPAKLAAQDWQGPLRAALNRYDKSDYGPLAMCEIVEAVRRALLPAPAPQTEEK